MASLNKVYLIGNLVREPELRVTPRGTAICQGGIAVNRQYKSESGEPTNETTFVDWEAWSKTGELISKYCSKGSPVLLEGRLKLDSWDDKASGQKRSKLKLVVENVQFLSGRGDKPADSSGQGEPGEPERSEPPPPRESPRQSGFGFGRKSTPPPPPASDIDEDVPF